MGGLTEWETIFVCWNLFLETAEKSEITFFSLPVVKEKFIKKHIRVLVEGICVEKDGLIVVLEKPVCCMNRIKDVSPRRNAMNSVIKLRDTQSLCRWRVSV